MKIKAIYIKNLKMSEGKVAAQVAHAVKNLGKTPTDSDIIVLGVSQNKFNELVKEHPYCYIQKDKGLTEVKSGTPTAAAWIVKDEITTLSYKEVSNGMYGLDEDVLFEYEGEMYKFNNEYFQDAILEYGIEDVLSVSGDFQRMLDNGIYEKKIVD